MHDDDDDLESRKHQLYRLAFDSDARPVVVFTQDGAVLHVNRAASKLLGRMGGELLERFAADADFTLFCQQLRLRGRAQAALVLRNGAIELEGRTHGDQLIVCLRPRETPVGDPRDQREGHDRSRADTVRPPARLSSLPTRRPKAMARSA